MASPHVAGAIALYLEEAPASTPAQVATILINGATPDLVSNLGTGSPNWLLYSLALQSDDEVIPPTPPTPPTPEPPTPPAPEACKEIVENGDFEAGNTAWQQNSSQDFNLICTQATCGTGLQPHGGDTLVWLGGANNERSRLSQTLTIPADAPAY